MCFLIVGCENIGFRKSLPAENQITYLNELQNWRTQGKLSIKVDKKRHSASFSWKQDSEDYDIHLYGPFGKGSTWLRKSQGMVKLENSQTGTREAVSAEALMERTFGWQIPISNLQYWIKGVPAKKADIANLDHNDLGYIARFQQQGWEVNYPKHSFIKGIPLPQKIVATRPGIKVVVVIKTWKMH